MSEHIVSVRIYFVIFLTLMVGTALTVWAGFQDFPWKTERYHCFDYCFDKSNAGHALLHAPPLQCAFGLDNFCFGAVLAGTAVCADLQRLLDA